MSELELRVFNSPEEPKVTYLRLKEERCPNGEHAVVLVVCNADGNTVPGGHLLEISSEGTFKRRGSVGEDLGFHLDGWGRIIEEE